MDYFICMGLHILVNNPEHIRVAIVAKLEVELEPHPVTRQDAVAPVVGAEKGLCGSAALLVAVFVVELVLSATIKKARELPHLIVVELLLPFSCRQSRGGGRGQFGRESSCDCYAGGCVHSVYMWAVEVRCGCKTTQTPNVLSSAVSGTKYKIVAFSDSQIGH